MKPEKLATIVFNSLTNIEKSRVTANLDNYGTAFFRKFFFTLEDQKVFRDKLKELLEGESNV